MTRSNHRRARLGSLIAMALGALALLAMPAAAAAKDRNHDHIPDRWEVRHHLSLKINQARHDQDRDHLVNMAEFRAGDNPRDDDSDNDGIEDGEENAGTIATFDAASGQLTINLFGGDTIAGAVTEQTRIKCEDEHSPDISDHSGEPGDDHGGSGAGSSSSHSGPGGHDDNGTGANCTVSDLIPGAVVQEAEVELENGAATFSKVELAG
jgi:hypothetical protein